jgi:hypothetical protein
MNARVLDESLSDAPTLNTERGCPDSGPLPEWDLDRGYLRGPRGKPGRERGGTFGHEYRTVEGGLEEGRHTGSASHRRWVHKTADVVDNLPI